MSGSGLGRCQAKLVDRVRSKFDCRIGSVGTRELQVNGLSDPESMKTLEGSTQTRCLGLRADRRVYLCCCWVAVVVGERQSKPRGSVARIVYVVVPEGPISIVQLSGNRVTRTAVNVKRRDRRWAGTEPSVSRLDRVISTSRTTGSGSNSVHRRRRGALQRDRLERNRHRNR